MNAIAEILAEHTTSSLTGSPTAELEVLQCLAAKREAVGKGLAGLLGVEVRGREELETQRRELVKEENRLRVRQFLFVRKCPVLAPEALKLRNEQGLPRTALFTTEHDRSSFSYFSGSGWLKTSPGLPENYFGVYDDIEQEMARVVEKKLRRAKQEMMFLLPIAVALIFLCSSVWSGSSLKALWSATGVIGALLLVSMSVSELLSAHGWIDALPFGYLERSYPAGCEAYD